jgi:hypothetical protein
MLAWTNQIQRQLVTSFDLNEWRDALRSYTHDRPKPGPGMQNSIEITVCRKLPHRASPGA